MSIRIFAVVLFILTFGSAAEAQPRPSRWSLFAGAGVSLASVNMTTGVVRTPADAVTLTEQFGIAYQLNSAWALRGFGLLAETPSTGALSGAFAPAVQVRAGVWFAAAGPLVGSYPEGIDAGIFMTTGIAIPLATHVRFSWGVQTPMRLARVHSLTIVTGLVLAYVL